MSTSIWQRVKTGSKTGFDKAWKAADKLGTPVNNLSNKLGSEAFWPTTLDKESDKAARILKSFCKDGFYAEETIPVQDGPKQKQKVFKKIPTSVIQNAKGLAIFTTMRTGLWFSGAGGSGILIARKEDGTWSPPSGILLHTAGLGFLVGVDIYDCVVVINTYEALEAFTKIRCTLGSEISVAAGPVGAGGVLDTEVHKRQAPIFTYLKSRGFYAGVQIDGTVIIERTDENERFYLERIGVKDILAGKVRHPPYEVRRLLETVKAAQGDTDVDESILPTEAPPGDFEVVDESHIFGVPDREDPDPYGVLALEKEGMSVKEAGTQKRASWETFNFNPSPTSPVHDMVRNSNSHEAAAMAGRSGSKRNSWRTSGLSNVGEARRLSTSSSLARGSFEARRSTVTMADTSTQTDDGALALPPTTSSTSPTGRDRRSGHSPRSSHTSLTHSIPEHSVLHLRGAPEGSDAEFANKANGYTTPPHTPPLGATAATGTATAAALPRGPPPALPPRVSTEQPKAENQTSIANDDMKKNDKPEDQAKDHEAEDEADDEDEEIDDMDEEANDDVQISSASAATTANATTGTVVTATPQMISTKPRIVDVPKRPPPPSLPPRNPNRSRGNGNGPLVVDASPISRDGSPSKGDSEGGDGLDVAHEGPVAVSDDEEREDGKGSQQIKLENHDSDANQETATATKANGLGEAHDEDEDEDDEPLKTNPLDKANAVKEQQQADANSTATATTTTTDGEAAPMEELQNLKESSAGMPGGW